jgi:hypothetical protein
MDLKVYYQKIRDIEKSIQDAFAVIVSLETPDGGKPGTLTEVSAGLAARMIVEGVARLAETKEAQLFRQRQAEAKRVADQGSSAGKVHLSVVPTDELHKLQSAVRPTKGSAN